MSVRRPTPDDLERLAGTVGLELGTSEIAELCALIDDALASYDWLETVAAADALRVPDRRGRAPTSAENPLGAWYWLSEIRNASSGPLAGRRVAVKDNIAVAGIPMTNGTVALDGYVPERDATVVARVLRAGGTIAGKAVCEALCRSGASHTSDSGPVRNPYDVSRSSGGSSSGCGALLAAGAVDLALGGDQGGSIRVPSSWCGVYGLKPTYGLVPYTGAFPLEMSLDHLGPMARTTEDVALLLGVIAGPDGLDPRQGPAPAAAIGPDAPARYVEALGDDLAGLRIGILENGFGWDGVVGDAVDTAVREQAETFAEFGAEVATVSVPEHRTAKNVAAVIGCEGFVALVLEGEGMGSNWKGRYSTSMMTAFARGRRLHANSLSPTVKLWALAGAWAHETFRGRHYAEAQNLAVALGRRYDDVLAEHDLLVMPTTPTTAAPLPDADGSLSARVAAAAGMGVNTAAFNVTGHPAMNVPCAMSDGLPVGMMLVGRRFDEAAVLRAAHAFEQNVFRPPAPAEAVASSEDGR